MDGDLEARGPEARALPLLGPVVGEEDEREPPGREARRANREIGAFIRARVDAPAGRREGGTPQLA